MDNLTPQQRAAVTRRAVSVVLSSGAGCGKTHVLTERYLSHLRDDGAEVGQVVAITFTDRAARQMRARIRRAVVTHLRAAASDTEADRWSRHLRGLETAPISTIHAFCGTLLRQYAVEAGLDPHFDVLEDVLSVNLEAEALTACLQRFLTAEHAAGEDLRELVVLYGWNPVATAVQQLLQAWDEPAWKRWLEQPAEEIAAQWQEHAQRVLLPRYVNFALASSPKITRCLDLLRCKPPLPGSKMAESVRLLQEQLPRLAEAADLAAAVEELTDAAKVGKHGAKAWTDPVDYQAARQALEDFREGLRGLELDAFSAPDEDIVKAAHAGQRFLRVAAEVVRAYRDLKRQHSVVDFQDLLVMARDLLRDQADVRARLQERYRFLLIDELQDTDPVQVQLAEYLCGGGLTAGKLFAVGDWKQSIYRFRGADVTLFRHMRQQVPHEGRLGLTVNFRSQPVILDFTNALLGHRFEDYEPLEPHHRQLNGGPCVEFLWSPRGDKEPVAEARRTEADWIARRIAAMVGQEALVVEERGTEGERLRPVRRGDVVLLFRAMSNVHLYEGALRKHGLDYYLVGGRAFFAQQEIYDLLSLLRGLENPQDAVSLAGTLRSPFCCLSDESLFVLSRAPGGIWQGLHEVGLCAAVPEDQRATVERARRNLDAWRGLKDRVPIAGLLGRVFADSGYDAAMQFEYLGDRKLANLWKLMDLARTFDRSGLFGVAEFIARLGELVRTQPREEQAATQPENADVVRLMSIHQAKGLEFPIVFVPDFGATGHDQHHPVARWDAHLGCVVRPPADEDPPPFPDFGWRLWHAAEKIEDWHEDMRTLYVACTRAQDYLVLSAAVKKPGEGTNPWMLTLAERFDPETGACRGPVGDEQHRPSVRVVKSQDDLGPVPAATAAPEPRFLPAADRAALEDIAAIPLRLSSKRVFTLGEVERLLRAENDGQDSLRATDLACQFDAEDGSDRNDWPRRREEIGPASSRNESVRDRILRVVLDRWDMRQSDGWRPLLARELEARPGVEAEMREQLATLLTRFAASDMRARLSTATACHREVELLADLPESDETWVRGVIDCLWQDGTGGWHALAFAGAGECPDLHDESWRDRDAGLVLAAWAAERRLGVGLRSVTRYCLETGEARSCDVTTQTQRRVLAAASRAVRACARRPLPH
jgi:ATP-dependent helicase/nuclease subunit A